MLTAHNSLPASKKTQKNVKKFNTINNNIKKVYTLVGGNRLSRKVRGNKETLGDIRQDLVRRFSGERTSAPRCISFKTVVSSIFSTTRADEN